ncbi:MAG: hypothetical protein ACYDD5_00010 [Sulfuricurvum sp.]
MQKEDARLFAQHKKDIESIKKVLKIKKVDHEPMMGWFEGELPDGRPFVAGRANGPLEANTFKNIKDYEAGEVEDTIFISK